MSQASYPENGTCKRSIHTQSFWLGTKRLKFPKPYCGDELEEAGDSGTVQGVGRAGEE